MRDKLLLIAVVTFSVFIGFIQAATPASAQARLVTVKRTASYGGPGGGNFESACPFGTVMTGLRARHGAWIDAVSPICSQWNATSKSFREVAPLPMNGGRGGGEGYMRCEGARGVIVSLDVFQANNTYGSVGHIIINCGDYLAPRRFWNKQPGSADYLGSSQRGRRVTLQCNAPLVAGGLFGRHGIYVDRIGLSCVNYQPR